MATFTVIDERDAPPRTKQSGRLEARMREYDAYIGGLKKGQVGRLTPGPHESARGVALRVSRAGKRAGRDVETWVVDGTVYFKTL